MRVKLPESKNLSGKALAAFKQKAKPLLAKLEDDSNTQIAKLDADTLKSDGS